MAPQQETEPWPSREAPRSTQISVRMQSDPLRRLRKLCKEERRTYGDMIEIMMDEYVRNH